MFMNKDNIDFVGRASRPKNVEMEHDPTDYYLAELGKTLSSKHKNMRYDIKSLPVVGENRGQAVVAKKSGGFFTWFRVKLIFLVYLVFVGIGLYIQLIALQKNIFELDLYELFFNCAGGGVTIFISALCVKDIYKEPPELADDDNFELMMYNLSDKDYFDIYNF